MSELEQDNSSECRIPLETRPWLQLLWGTLDRPDCFEQNVITISGLLVLNRWIARLLDTCPFMASELNGRAKKIQYRRFPSVSFVGTPVATVGVCV